MVKGGRDRKTFQLANVAWALDSGAFTELKDHGLWRMDAVEYAELVNRYDYYIGRLEWVSPQDWMCEPIVIHGGRSKAGLFVGTKLNVETHQYKTVENFLQLQELCSVKVIPVLQGYTIDEYFRCIRIYEKFGVDLTEYDTVGLGSVCRRQADDEIAELIDEIYQTGINMHAFGVKEGGLIKSIDKLVSADSLTWSLNAKYKFTTAKGTCCGRLKKCGNPIKNCANCYHAAMDWADKLAVTLGRTEIYDFDRSGLFKES